MLPIIKEVKLPSLTLPTAWQTVIFRNYGYVREERIAAVLSCSAETVRLEAERMGLVDRGYAEDFEKSGYITVIRNNWFLLPYPQLLTLLGIDEARLDFILEKDDFLAVKLGNFKPECPTVTYAPLSVIEKVITDRLAKCVGQYESEPECRPFDFFPEGEQAEMPKILARDGKRIVHGYLSPCGDAFATDGADTLPDELLKRYQAVGVNGIWLHAVLSSLSPYPFMPSLSEGYEERRANMNKIIERCKKYGISLYLYMNEPRALPVGVTPEHEKLIGWQSRRTLCMEQKEVREYLYEAVRDLCASAPDLGGIFTITMSENPTHCNFTHGTECPVCKNIPMYKSASQVNNVIHRAMKDSGCGGELIANLWGWSSYLLWSEEDISNGIRSLDEDISILSVSEYDLEIEKGGVKSRVIDYSISNPGPSEVSVKNFALADLTQHKKYAKIQASNSWECAAVPYIPVFDLVFEHLKNLHACGVDDLFLTWTQGGYPSPSVALACEFGENFDLEAWYERSFGDDRVRGAIELFCKAFRNYPFSVKALYLSPHTLGPANLWDIEPEEKGSTMVCFAYDDIESWVVPYGADVYLSQMDIMCHFWKEGIELLELAEKNAKTEELLRYAKVVYCHYMSDILQTKFALYKRENNRAGMLGCVEREKKNAEELLSLMKCDARIGYEASNHYFYTERNLMEKILRMDVFEEMLNMVFQD